ncbi:MAG: VanZ family protein [Prevotella sp.]|nr:VanZ family protein [Prevotella sp.]
MSDFIRKYPFTTVVIIMIWILCLIPIPEKAPLSDVTMIDKWTHIVMYLFLSLVIAFEYKRTHQHSNMKSHFLYIWLLPALMGGLLEVIQAYCTNGMRSGEWMDFFADTTGSTIAFIICILLAKCRAKA